MKEIEKACSKERTFKVESTREELFNRVKNAICEVGDIPIINNHGVTIGIGTNLIYNDKNGENVSLHYIHDVEEIELCVNNKIELKINKNSPILEALYKQNTGFIF